MERRDFLMLAAVAPLASTALARGAENGPSCDAPVAQVHEAATIAGIGGSRGGAKSHAARAVMIRWRVNYSESHGDSDYCLLVPGPIPASGWIDREDGALGA